MIQNAAPLRGSGTSAVSKKPCGKVGYGADKIMRMLIEVAANLLTRTVNTDKVGVMRSGADEKCFKSGMHARLDIREGIADEIHLVHSVQLLCKHVPGPVEHAMVWFVKPSLIRSLNQLKELLKAMVGEHSFELTPVAGGEHCEKHALAPHFLERLPRELYKRWRLLIVELNPLIVELVGAFIRNA